MAKRDVVFDEIYDRKIKKQILCSKYILKKRLKVSGRLQ